MVMDRANWWISWEQVPPDSGVGTVIPIDMCNDELVLPLVIEIVGVASVNRALKWVAIQSEVGKLAFFAHTIYREFFRVVTRYRKCLHLTK